MTTLIDALSARTQFGRIMNEAEKKNVRFLVSRRGKPKVVILGVEDYLKNIIKQPKLITNVQISAKEAGLDRLRDTEIEAEIKTFSEDQKEDGLGCQVIRVVLDTNVVISALLKEDSTPALILSLVLDGQLKLCMTEEIFAEYTGVLSREKFKGLDHASVKKILLSVRRKSLLVSPSTKINVIKMDPEDNKFLECALETQADHLVTGNRRHFTMAHYDKTRIVGPGDFLYRIVKEMTD